MERISKQRWAVEELGNTLTATPKNKCNLRETVTVKGGRPLVRSEMWFSLSTRSLRPRLGAARGGCSEEQESPAVLSSKQRRFQFSKIVKYIFANLVEMSSEILT